MRDKTGANADNRSMNLAQGFQLFWKRTFDWRGRTSRSEFWWGVLGNALIMVVLLVLLTVSLTCFHPPVNGVSIWMIALFALFCLVELLPSVTLIIRRMHDIGKSGTYILVLLIPVFGFLWYLFLVTRPGVPPRRQAVTP